MAKNKVPKDKTTVYRSSITGRFVSKEYAKKHPKTTYEQGITQNEDDSIERVVEEERAAYGKKTKKATSARKKGIGTSYTGPRRK